MVSSAYVIRHGETAWSRSGRHTGRTEVPLSAEGEESARRLAGALSTARFSLVLTSPRGRARRTCELAGLGGSASAEADLAEWDYGDYEGLTSAEILRTRPGWVLFRDGCPGGESPGQVSARADRLLARLAQAAGEAALFTHGHFGRALAARWAGMPVGDGQHLLLDTASFGVLSFEHGNPAAPVIARWNVSP